MYSIVPVLDDLVSNAYQPSIFGRGLCLMDEFKNQLGSTNEVKTLEDNSKQLVLGINVETFKPEEIKVSIKENFLEISANHEEKTEHSFVKRQFSRRFLLPENAIQQKMNCSMNSSGVLKITIPKNPEKAVDKPVTIPIQFQK